MKNVVPYVVMITGLTAVFVWSKGEQAEPPAALRNAPAGEVPGVPTVITVRCAHKPESISIAAGGRLLWQSRSPDLHEEAECLLPLKQDSATLTVSARWPEGTPDTPVTLELEPEGKRSVSATRWSFGPSLNDTYSFSWN